MSIRKKALPLSTIRVTGGMWRGQRFSFTPTKTLRPTIERFREMLFNWLMGMTEDAVCLDAFAGTGVLGMEALSRGAKKVIFLENTVSLVKQIKTNLQMVHCLHGYSIYAETMDWLSTEPVSPFDLVFLDPPFYQINLTTLCHILEKRGWVHTGSFVYIESGKETRYSVPLNWKVHKKKHTPQIQFVLYYVDTNSEKNSDI